MVVLWLRICLAMQGTQVQSLVWEDLTCCRATELMCYKFGSLGALETVLHNTTSHWNEKPMH